MAGDPSPSSAQLPRFIFFTDFDGTVTQQDSNDFMTDNIGFGRELRLADNKAVLFGKRTFRDSFREMMDSVTKPFDQCIEYLLENITPDPYFEEFFVWCRANDIPVIVLSGGMEPIIRALLDKFLPSEEVRDLPIVSNQVKARPGKTINEEGGWAIEFHDDSSFGHDKSIEIRKYSSLPERPIMFYAGDGVSDLSAAKETDLLFAKAGRDLVTWCENEKVPFVTFQDFSSILQTVKDIVSGKLKVEDAALGRIH